MVCQDAPALGQRRGSSYGGDGQLSARCWPEEGELTVRLEETLEYRCYLCLAKVCGTLVSDYLGSDGHYDDSGDIDGHLTELHGADIDKVFQSQHVVGVYGSQRWAFADPGNGFKGDDLRARLFHDRDRDVYYLVNPPSETFDDNVNSVMTAMGMGVPDKFHQAAQLIELVRPEFRDRIVLSGLSLGGALSAYAAIKASWPVRTIVFDPLGLNRKMMGKRGLGFFGQGEVLSERFRSLDSDVDWFYIAKSWVAENNVRLKLSSVGRVTELPQDPVRARNNKDTHDFRHVRFGLHQLWEQGWRGSAPGPTPNGDAVAGSTQDRAVGVLVADDVLPGSDSTASTIMAALEVAAVPIAVEYFPASEVETTTYRTVPVNAAAQRAIVELVKVANPAGPTVFRVVLPKGAELARAVGGGGFRGFSTGPGGKIAAQAVLKPVAMGGKLLAAWPVLAVAGTVMALDMLAQRQQQAHQRRVEEILGRMEERYYFDRLKGQRTADAQLSRIVSLILDGDDPPLDVALKSAYDEFHRSQVWLEKYDGVVSRVVGPDGKVDFNRLQGALGGNLPDFFRELHLASAAIAIQRKALLADAAAKALADPSNPYTALRKLLESQASQIEEADRIVDDLSTSLSIIRIRGGWPDPPRKVRDQEHWVQGMASSPTVEADTAPQFLLKASGEIVQVLPPRDDAA